MKSVWAFEPSLAHKGRYSVARSVMAHPTRLPSNLKPTTRECGHSIRSAVAKNPMLHANFMAICVISCIESFLCDRTQAVSIARVFLSCGVPQGSVLGPVFFLVYCADVTSIARRCGRGIHSYAVDSQLYFDVDTTNVDNKVKQLVACTEEISHWMSANRLKLNTDKTQFIWLRTAHQLSATPLQ